MIQRLALFSKRIAFGLFFLFYSNILLARFASPAYNPDNIPPADFYIPSVYINEDIAEYGDVSGDEKNLHSEEVFEDLDGSPVTANLNDSIFREEEKVDGGGPTQPEMQAFSSVNNTNMVDLFSGDFSYNIPLLDVGGYPVNISYRSGVTMDQEASWVGLGWNINPGTITRNMRGLPDDFNGGKDTITKTATIKENKTIGVTAGANIEIFGTPLGIGASLGIFNNNYKGWGLETGLNASLNSGAKVNGALTGGLSLTNNSQEGLTISPSLSVSLNENEAKENGGIAGSLTTSLNYNSRTGLKGLQLQAGLRQYSTDNKNQVYNSSPFSSSVSFATPSYTPTISMPYTSNQYSFTGKLGIEGKGFHGNFFISGYVSKQRIDSRDVTQVLPAFGYLNYQKGSLDKNALLDFNREKEIAYREKPAIAHIAVPNYTYDLFSITGEGTGGMFRAYRSDIGFMYDHLMRTKSESLGGSIDIGAGPDISHGGADVNLNRFFTENSAWLEENAVKNNLSFKNSDSLYEAVYFKNPGEKAINSKAYYDSIGGDDVVAVNLYQAGNSSSIITATNFLNRYRNKSLVGQLPLTSTSTIKKERDKRNQVISYLTAQEASAAGFSKYIESNEPNVFACDTCKRCAPNPTDEIDGFGDGLKGEYYTGRNFETKFGSSFVDPTINFSQVSPVHGFTNDFSVRWNGRLKAPVTGTYIISTNTDDGVRLWINDSLFINDWNRHGDTRHDVNLNLTEGELCSIKLEYYQGDGPYTVQLLWKPPGSTQSVIIPKSAMYSLPARDAYTSNGLTKEKRINTFRRANHISEMTVLNADGRRYIYGIPVYNLLQKEATFSVDYKGGNSTTGLSKYVHNTDNTIRNVQGNDRYFSSETIPAYAHSFLLTAIVSPDYVDVSGDGISDDDRGDAVKFNYSKVAGIMNPYKWRAPFGKDSVTYNEGLKTDYRDDKGNYVYGEKELWYMHSIESKSMIATFTLEERLDAWGVDEQGAQQVERAAKRLKEINLYSKADFLKNGTKAVAIKTVHFDYTYGLCKGIKKQTNDTTGKLTLNKIWFSYNGNDKGRLNPYVFNYHPNNPSYNIKSYDKWGNYKDPLQNPGSKQKLLTNAEFPYALKDSTAAAVNAGAWHLNNINLPSGGRINVTYESDDYAYVQNKRAMEMFKIYGFGSTNSLANASLKLYDKTDNLYVFVKLSSPVASGKEAFNKYLQGITKLYFKLSVKMPVDKYGDGYEYVPCYADMDVNGGYGIASSTVMWIKLKGISIKGDEDGTYSPLAKAAIQFLRLNLSSKAYPGSEVGDNIDFRDAVSIVLSQADNIRNAFTSFDSYARNTPAAYLTDTSRTFIRLNSPEYKKIGGGHRVKRIEIFDNWKAMTGGTTGQKESSYGQEYDYTTVKEIDGKKTRISSGVASYEPMIGSDENPFHVPIEYVEKIAPLGPVTLGYTEEPLGEAFFPSAAVGYSKVRVRSIHTLNKRSANGYEETEFYTAYDFPTVTDRSMIDKKRYKPSLSNFLKINAKHFISLSQGFKVELNDMHGKIKTQATYAETDADHPLTYTKNVYKVENQSADAKQLSNKVMVMNPQGIIDSAGIIGKDIELMTDMRQQLSVVNGNNFNVNADFFSLPFPPVFLIPTFLGLAQREETRFRSVAVTKIIQRYGILDSVIHIDKGSVVSTKNMLYDSETGDVLLTRTQNEFNDPIYNFIYPSHWAYDGMGLAYKNIGAILNDASIKNGKIVKGLRSGMDTVLFASGDEVLVASKSRTSGAECNPAYSTFANYGKVWAIDANAVSGGAKKIYFINADGSPFSGNDVTLKVVRSGRRNINGSVGSVTALNNPVVKIGSNYVLRLDTASKVINASAIEMKQLWKVADRKTRGVLLNCYDVNYTACANGTNCNCTCLKQLFNYLISARKLFLQASDNKTVRSLVQEANSAGFAVQTTDCPILAKNADKLFYSLSADTAGTVYRAHLGSCTVSINSANNKTVSFYGLKSKDCLSNGALSFYMLANGNSSKDTVTLNVPLSHSMICYRNEIDPYNEEKDTTSDKLLSEYKFQTTNIPVRSALTVMRFNDLSKLPSNAQIISAQLNLFADLRGHVSSTYPNAHSVTGLDPGVILVNVDNYLNWNYSTSFIVFDNLTNVVKSLAKSNSFQDFTGIDLKNVVRDYVIGSSNSNSFILKESYDGKLGESLLYSTFYSHKSTNVSKRPSIVVKYNLPSTDTVNAVLAIESCNVCDTLASDICYSTVTDTVVNPYTTGILGNFRAGKSYTYFTNRTEMIPDAKTDIRTCGTFSDFYPFWKFAGSKLVNPFDTTKWVWNSEITLFNSKGAELENKDPLGRFNAGLYGYNITLPTAVIQNSRYREAGYEGFEDYGFSSSACDTACPVSRHFNFTALQSRIDSTQHHTGKYSFRLNPNAKVSISATVVSSDTAYPALAINTSSNACNSTQSALKGIKASSNSLLPIFSPLAGKQYLISAWVKEDKDCKCEKYTGNSIIISVKRTGLSDDVDTLYPSGNIIEGWQRYEDTVTLSSAATSINIAFKSTSTSAVYFDDIRIHPFNANMKSFVYHPVNLRLTAELDENNYATFYEYDDDGTLVRVKKETQRGIKTIKETRSALLKENQ